MLRSGKMLRLSSDRSIYILENEDGSYITENLEIRYRNIGKNFESVIIQTNFINVTEEGIVEVLDATSKPMFFFPALWLDTDQMKIMSLVAKGLLKFSE